MKGWCLAALAMTPGLTLIRIPSRRYPDRRSPRFDKSSHRQQIDRFKDKDRERARRWEQERQERERRALEEEMRWV